jgi:hypothetical protein
MSILGTIDRLSYKKILSIGFLLAVAFSIPTTLLLVDQQTKLSSSAHVEKPPVIPRAKQNYGPAAQTQIEVTRVYPFLGKAGDELVILGGNFGTNPAEKRLTVGGVDLQETDIDVWQDNMITAYLPANANSGLVEIQSGSFHWISKAPFTIYDTKTQTQIKKAGNSLIVVSPTSNIAKMTYSMVNGQITEVKTKLAANGTFELTIPNGEVDTLALYDSENRLIPFYVDPLEFGF